MQGSYRAAWAYLWLLTLCVLLAGATPEDGASNAAEELHILDETDNMGLDHVPPLAPKRGRARPELDPVDEDGDDEDEEDEGFGQVDDPELPELAESEEMTVGERADMGLLSAADTMNQGAKLLGKVKETIANPGKLLAKLKNASQTGFQKAEKLDDIDGVKPVSIFSLGGAMKDSPVGKLVKDKMKQLGKFAGTLIDDSPFRGLKTSATSIQEKLNDPKTKKVAQTMSSPEKALRCHLAHLPFSLFLIAAPVRRKKHSRGFHMES